MTLQNRSNPFGNIHASSTRGTLMGNRGGLHNAEKQIAGRHWVRKAWVACALEFNGRKREVMSPGSYTELFFLDEATALAAGHRPCATCRRHKYKEFLGLFQQTQNDHSLGVGDLDRILHSERFLTTSGDQQNIFMGNQIPNGCFAIDTQSKGPVLRFGGKWYGWDFSGYSPSNKNLDKEEVVLLTPKSTMLIIKNGYTPNVHSSADTAGNQVKSSRKISYAKRRRVATSIESKPEKKLQNKTAVIKQAEVKKLYRLEKTPAGRELWTYFAAILQEAGMDKGAPFPLKKMFSNFQTHLDAKRIENIGAGLFRLTEEGAKYFKDRFSAGNRQHVNQQDVDAYKKQLRSGGQGWIAIDL